MWRLKAGLTVNLNQNICLIIRSFLLRNRVPTLYVSDHKQRSYLSLKLPKNALFPPLLHNIAWRKQSVRTSPSHMSMSAWLLKLVLTAKRETRP